MKDIILSIFIISLFALLGCSNSNSNTEKKSANVEKINSNEKYIEKGKQIALKAKGVLGKNLLKAIHQKGTEGALSFCSDKAIYLTDSISYNLGVKIKRVSNKNRNSSNSPSSIELEFINKVKEDIANGEKPSPQILEEGNKIVGYFPIMTNAMCLQCHGQKYIDISPNVATKIDSLYPNDKAIGYKENELRGIWVIEMMK